MNLSIPRRLGATKSQALPCAVFDAADLVKLGVSDACLKRGALCSAGKQSREGKVVEKAFLVLSHLVLSHPVFIVSSLRFPVERVWGRMTRVQSFDLCANLGGIDARLVFRRNEDVVIELPHVFGELSQAGIIVERVEQNGFVEAL